MAAPETQNRIFDIISTSSWNFEIQSYFVTWQTGQENVKVKTTGLVHIFLILANC